MEREREPMIELRGVTKRFGDTVAVEGVSMTLARGASVAALGPSGSGKTTLLRLIAGLETPDEGEALLDGEVASRPGWVLAPHLRGMGFVFQQPALWPHMSVARNVAFGLGGLPREQADARLDEALEQTGLTALRDRLPGQLSGGEARRVALARALAPRPDWLLMDEPLTNLDTEAKDGMLELIAQVVGETEAGLVYVTHDESEASRIAERVVRLRDGRLEPDGEVAQ